MALPPLNLDNRTYADLVEEARAQIPKLCPQWTDHNPMDPGITLIELFAWLTEMLIYRANQIPDQHKIVFLKLLKGPDWIPDPDHLTEAIRTSVSALRRRDRAVTSEDYEVLAGEAAPEVGRAKCMPRRYLDAGSEAERLQDREGYVSVIIVPWAFKITDKSLAGLQAEGVPDAVLAKLQGIKDQVILGKEAFATVLGTTLGEDQTIRFKSLIFKYAKDQAPQPPPSLCQTVWNDLDGRRLLTTRHYVVGPIYAPVSAEILIARQADMPEQRLRDQVVQALQNFLHPLTGGPDGQGWPFGRDIYVSELYQVLEGVPGLDYVPDIALSSQCPAGVLRCVTVPSLWHENGDLVGLQLAEHHLPLAQIDPSQLVIAATFVPVQVTVQATPVASQVPAEVYRAIKTAVKQLGAALFGHERS